MQLIDMFYDQIEDTVARRVPYVIPIGTLEYHARHASCGTDTLVITGCLRELEKEKEVVICPPVWYGVALLRCMRAKARSLSMWMKTHMPPPCTAY